MSRPTNEQLQGLVTLFELAQRDHGGANVAAKFLLGLYNGQRFPFDLTELRRFDVAYMEAALAVLAMDWRPQLEVHAQLAVLQSVPTVRMNYAFEQLAHDWKLKGRCTKDELANLKARAFQGEPA